MFLSHLKRPAFCWSVIAISVGVGFSAKPVIAPSDQMEVIRAGEFAPPLTQPLETAEIFNWNIERGTYLPEIVDSIRRHKPDICILQEVDLHAKRSGGIDVAKELAKTFGFDYVFGTEFQELSQGDGEQPAFHGQAILSRLPLRRTRILRFVHQTNFWKPKAMIPLAMPFMQRRLGGRMALVSEIDKDHGRLVIYDLHLESREGENLRLLQLNEVLADAAQYGPEDTVIIAGDLNTQRRGSPVLPRLRAAGYESCLGARKLRTHMFIGALDWVFMRGPGHFEDGAVYSRDRGSDHYPIATRLKLD